jgi:hypothetical protein
VRFRAPLTGTGTPNMVDAVYNKECPKKSQEEELVPLSNQIYKS